MINDKKIAFIICSNNELKLSECVNYLQRLIIPNGYETDLLVVKDAKSMLAGMEEGALSTDAKYKVYMHQDVFIVNKYFLSDMLTIFDTDERIGLIGMIGSVRLSPLGVMWFERRVGNVYGQNSNNLYDYKNYRFDISDGIVDAECVDGFLMATSADTVFRKEIFDGWDFYDVSLSFEFIKQGMRVVVPNQTEPWCIHDDGGLLSLGNYNTYRKKALEYYSDVIQRPRNYIYNEAEIRSLLPGALEYKRVEIIELIYHMLSNPEGRMLMQKKKEYSNLFKCIMSYKLESEAGNAVVFDNVYSMEDINVKSSLITFILYRVASNRGDDELEAMIEEMNENKISVYALAVFAKYFGENSDKVECDLAEYMSLMGKKTDAIRFLYCVVKMNENKETAAMKLVDMFLDMNMTESAVEVVRNTCLKEKEEFAEFIK